MFRDSKTPRLKTAVKLFPRLATPRVSSQAIRLGTPIVGRVPVVVTATSCEAEASRVRAKLLRMILDNESARRHGWRPSAS